MYSCYYFVVLLNIFKTQDELEVNESDKGIMVARCMVSLTSPPRKGGAGM